MKEEGTSFENALANAQRLGYAEADPTADVDGFDSCRKICILSAVAFGNLVSFEDVETVGIRSISLDDINRAEQNGASVKLIARAVKTESGKVHISVRPYAVRKNNPLYAISDVFNGILVRGKISGDLMFYGKGAGKLPTAGAVVSDIIDIGTRGESQPPQVIWSTDCDMLAKTLPDSLTKATEVELGYPIA